MFSIHYAFIQVITLIISKAGLDSSMKKERIPPNNTN
jgi:hypothetical protein